MEESNSVLIENLKAAETLPSLKEIYKDRFMIGSIFTSDTINGTYLPFLKRHFNVLTASKQMKSARLSESEGVYDFKEVDRLIKIIEGEKITLHGHTLLWHEVHAGWLTNAPDGKSLTRAEALKNMSDYISATAGRYAGKLYSWDVVNEAFRDGAGAPEDWRSALRTDGSGGGLSSPWYQSFENGADKEKGESGADYIEAAFRLARKADPHAKLYYNDYNLDNQDKAESAAKMIKEINDRWISEGNDRLLIEGAGMQGHYDLNTKTADVEKSILRFIDLGVEISVSELDVCVFGWDKNKDNKLKPTESQYDEQAKVYAGLFKIYKKYSDNIARVTFWGTDDGTSWRKENYPLLFGADYRAKPAFFAVSDPEGYLEGKYNSAGR